MEKVLRATELDIAARGLVLPGGFRIDTINLEFPALTVPCSPWRAVEGTRVDVKIRVTSEDVATYLNAKQPGGLSDFQVGSKGGTLQIVALMKIAILPVEVGAEGVLEFENSRLNFIPSRAEIGGVGAPDAMVREQFQKVNPLIDLTGWPVKTTVKSIEIGDGEILLEGTLVLTADIPRRGET